VAAIPSLGGAKALPGTVTEEKNPAIGWRSLRIGLDRPALVPRHFDQWRTRRGARGAASWRAPLAS